MSSGAPGLQPFKLQPSAGSWALHQRLSAMVPPLVCQAKGFATCLGTNFAGTMLRTGEVNCSITLSDWSERQLLARHVSTPDANADDDCKTNTQAMPETMALDIMLRRNEVGQR
eukprot:CAMPEP_0204054376 /NCGR_PEP_ID=MMETSP0360-20130528/128427_1 /ASSEMBLY_ACC=CAM_ASM_000342 /TAXON_ID=268821 /ORGANISM="Scrippsiella Hangoei, Strain SHTV-5" /LENGTH=113 /DNA_ID=CAMNT_0051001635 /DNA_START=22 /DNA_END=360 /DNA_ORIENTATION=-